MFKKILIATDGSKHSEMAAKVGIELAVLSKGSVTALYVADTAKYVAPIGGLSEAKMTEVLEKLNEMVMVEGMVATEHVEKVASAASVPCQTKIVEGHPVEEILKLARPPVDVLVMGRIGMTGIERLMMGSVAEKVCRSSKVHVLVAHCY
ncbi:MAG: universal stress protein [Methanotrichaceae archaeon]|nr:universal stress protein [Methanotrichaceae archaeon]